MPGAGGKIFCERKNVVKITLTQHLIRKSANQEAGQDWTCERPLSVISTTPQTCVLMYFAAKAHLELVFSVASLSREIQTILVQ